MNIFPDYKTIILSPPKTGTNALALISVRHTPSAPGLTWHIDYVPEEYQDWKKYISIRHPFTRAVSLYGWWLRREEGKPNDCSFLNFIHTKLFGGDWFYSSTIYDRYGHIPVNGVLPNETLQVSLWSIGIRLVIPKNNVGHIESVVMTNEIKDLLIKWGKPDFDNYGYEIE